MGDIRRLGITGSRTGATLVQVLTLTEILYFLHRRHYFTLHHGCCLGVDTQAHSLAREIGYNTVGHPPVNEKWLSFGLIDDVRQPPKEYLDRNHDIVDAVHGLLVVPAQAEELLRSGTWATYRYARKQNKPTYLILPTGQVLIEGTWPIRVPKIEFAEEEDDS